MRRFKSPDFTEDLLKLVDQASADVRQALGRTMPEVLHRLEDSGILEDRDFRLFLFYFYDACGFMHRRIEGSSQPGKEDSPEEIDAEMYACLFHALMEMEGYDGGNPVYVKIRRIVDENDDVIAFLWVGFQCFTLLARSSVKNEE